MFYRIIYSILAVCILFMQETGFDMPVDNIHPFYLLTGTAIISILEDILNKVSK